MKTSLAEAAEGTPLAVTLTSTEPAIWGGVVTVTCVAESTVKVLAAVVPNVTPLTFVKFVPVIVTQIPPFVAPAFRLIALTVGAGT